MPNNPRDLQRRQANAPWLRLAGAGAELAAAVLGFTLVGYGYDRYFGTQPWGLLAGALAGLVGGLANFFRTSLKTLKASSEVHHAESPRDSDNHG